MWRLDPACPPGAWFRLLRLGRLHGDPLLVGIGSECPGEAAAAAHRAERPCGARLGPAMRADSGRRGKRVSRQLQIKTAAVPSGDAVLQITVENTRAVFACNTTQLGSPAH